MKEYSYTSTTPMGCTACTETECLVDWCSDILSCADVCCIHPSNTTHRYSWNIVLGATPVLCFLTSYHYQQSSSVIRCSSCNPLNLELNPICYLLALLAHHFLHVSRIRVKSLTLRLLMSYIYIYGAPILDVSRSHTTTQHSR